MSSLRDTFRPLFHILTTPFLKIKCCETQSELQKYKDRYEGKRCFIVANGPSLNVADLDRLKKNNEITFGMNRIYVLFDKTIWRPDFYLSQDPSIIRSSYKEMEKHLEGIQKFIKLPGEPWYVVKNAVYFNLDYKYANKRVSPLFGNGEKCRFVDGRTVTYTAIQFAAYMGFKKIYLLGCDSNYSSQNKIITRESYPDERMYVPDKMGMNPDMEYNFKAYEIAENYSRKNAFRIYNATRGGMLEIFERVDFDTLF